MKQIFILREADNKMNTPDALFKNIESIDIDYKQENLILFCLNTKNQVVHNEIVFKGGLNAAVVDARTIFRIALQHNACGIIIAHNHPSGDLKPSEDDERTFNMIKKAGELIDVSCLDSIIFNKTQFYSLKGGM